MLNVDKYKLYHTTKFQYNAVKSKLALKHLLNKNVLRPSQNCNQQNFFGIYSVILFF